MWPAVGQYDVAAVHNFDHGPAFFTFFVGLALFGIGCAMVGDAIARFALGPQNWMFRCLITRAATCEQP
ncbi:MAG TPA: hypothetical protein VGX71_10075 [Pseudaminobacter sp.]|nr:hypothetical protein [Pseudaminobacter sp.]